MPRVPILACLLLALALALAACGDDDRSDAELRTELITALTDADALDRQTAECAADSILAEFDGDDLTAIAAGRLDELSDEQFSLIAEGIVACGAAQ